MMLNTLKRTTIPDLFLEYFFIEAHIKGFLGVIKGLLSSKLVQYQVLMLSAFSDLQFLGCWIHIPF
jgi:hypothetical protein